MLEAWRDALFICTGETPRWARVCDNGFLRLWPFAPDETAVRFCSRTLPAHGHIVNPDYAQPLSLVSRQEDIRCLISPARRATY